MARINKRELFEKDPQIFKFFVFEDKTYIFFKEDVLERFKKDLTEVIAREAKEKNCVLIDEIIFRENSTELIAIGLAHPRFEISKIKKRLKINPKAIEKFKEELLKELEKFEFKPVVVEEWQEVKSK